MYVVSKAPCQVILTAPPAQDSPPEPVPERPELEQTD